MAASSFDLRKRQVFLAMPAELPFTVLQTIESVTHLSMFIFT